ncbi:oligosaccharide flippase family protein [Flavobacterium sp. LS2P90]|uniref:Oligosaccharide flippase family protein n=1 Tax=Flavobacterium xylosi TaxID=3230415 RepID=A0ABW6HZW6_9FLAO
MKGSKLIIKNTGILYVKTFITMGIALYSTRVILNTLGAVDYGLFSLIAGVIAMLTFLNNSLSSSTQRFLEFNLGAGQQKKLSEVFNASVFLHLLVGLIVVLLVEGVGYIAFEKILIIPVDRMYAARAIFHFMVISTFFTIISVPYDAIINAHEHMLFDSIVGIIQSFGILFIAIFIQQVNTDKLIWYGLLMASLIFVLLIIRRIYCRVLYAESKINFKTHLNRATIKEMLTYASWTFFGAITSMFGAYGMIIVLNSFFGAKVNAAYGIAAQLNGQINVFSATMMKALNPQIVKSEGSGERNRMIKIAMTGSKMSFFLLAFFAIPFILEAPYVLKLWLINPPEYTIVFSRLVLIVAMFSQLSMPIGKIVNAVGNIKHIEVYSSIIYIMVLLVAILLFNLGFPPFYVYFIQILSEILLLVIRTRFANKMADMKIQDFIDLVLKPVLIVTLSALIITFCIQFFMNESFLRLLITISISSAVFLISLNFWGLALEEKQYINDVFCKIKKKVY